MSAHTQMGKSSIVTWNVNGLVACIKRMGMGSLGELLESFGNDVAVVCVQETKIYGQSSLDHTLCKPPGWDAFYTVSKKKQGKGLGYSGVATFCRQSKARPIAAEEGFTSRCTTEDIGEFLPAESSECKWMYEALGEVNWIETVRNTSPAELKEMDGEGRVLVTDHGEFCILNCYFPAMRMSEERLDAERLLFKLRFNTFFQQAANRLRSEGKRLVVVGDFNIALEAQDRPDASDDAEFNSSPSRVWMRSLLRDCCLGDLFRVYHPDRKDAFTMFDMRTGGRLTNYGSRLDYILVDNTLLKAFAWCDIDGHQGSHAKGSDHCFVAATLSQAAIGPPLYSSSASQEEDTMRAPPGICASFFPEARARQQDMKAFLTSTMGDGRSEDAHRLLESEGREPLLRLEGEESGADDEHDDVCLWELGDSGGARRGGSSTDTVESGSKLRQGGALDGGDSKRARTAQAGAGPGPQPTAGVRKSTAPWKQSQVKVTSFFARLSSQEGDAEPAGKGGDGAESKEALEKKRAAASAWGKLLGARQESNPKFTAPSYLSEKEQKAFLDTAGQAPLCKSHQEPCILRVVSKKGVNAGRKFWVCARPNGREGDPSAKCNCFSWA